MCGIAGIIGRVDQRNRAALQAMCDAMVHRGPDAAGRWESAPDPDGWGLLLGHRRLSILDLSPAGAQPMADPVTGHVVAFNGEIYNYRELRRDLSSQGQQFRSSGDTEVMLRALALQGAEALGRLRGMFALAVWDPGRRRLLLARDPLGIKPLYLACQEDPRSGWSLAFASELRALLASGLLGTPRLDPAAIASAVWNGFVVGPGTAVSGVRLLDPGSLLEVDGQGRAISSREFWTIAPVPAGAATTEDELGAVLEEGVRQHLESDVPLAMFLSGGVDSSAVANLAQRASGRPVNTFTLAFEEQELNEGPYARRIAEAIGSQHREVVLTQDHFVRRLDEALDHLDQPTFDAINSFYMSRAIRDAGFTVALVGTGGDELFGGYSSFRDLPPLHRALRLARAIPRQLVVAAARLATAGLRRRGAPVPPQTRWAKLPDMVARGEDLLGLYQMAYALFLPGFQRELLAPGPAGMVADGLAPEMRRRLAREVGQRTPLSAISVMEQRIFLGERLLRDNDAASMACSLEQRVPLVDRVLFDAVDRLPDAIRYRPVGRKDLLRRIGLKGLSPALFERPKSGFVLPFDRWIRSGLRPEMDATLRDSGAVARAGLVPAAVERLWRSFLEGAPGMYWSRVWAVYVLVRWCERHKVHC